MTSASTQSKSDHNASLQWTLSFTSGYLALEMADHAHEELKNVPPHLQDRQEVLDLRIQVLMARKKFHKAARLAALAIRLFPKFVDFYIYGANAWESLDEPAKAKAFWMAAPELYRHSGFFYYNLARCEAKLGDYFSARNHIAKAVTIDPDLKEEFGDDLGLPQLLDDK